MLWENYGLAAEKTAATGTQISKTAGQIAEISKFGAP